MAQGGDGQVKDRKGDREWAVSVRKLNTRRFRTKTKLQGTRERGDITLKDTVEDTEK